MEDVKEFSSENMNYEQQKIEKEQFSKFMDLMVQIIEKHAQSVLQELEQVA